MKLHDLIKITTKKAKRVGRGHGSGKGKTSTRGSNGQKSKEKVKLGFEGGQLRLIKRLPFLRGVGNPRIKAKPITLNLVDLNSFEAGEVVDKKSLVEKKIISPREVNLRVKVLSKGEISKPLRVRLKVSCITKEKIEKAGGKVQVND